MAQLRLPPTLPPLFPELPRRLDVDASTVVGALRDLDGRWPGLFDRLCQHGPTLRPHIHVYVDGKRASLDDAIDDRSRVDVVAAISGG
jgi:sulfur carrier protein ThiS